MQLNAYCIYDNKSLSYGAPFFAPSDGSAIRSFTDLANDSQTMVGRHPRDFSLFCVGGFDDANALLVATTPVRHVVDGLACIVEPAELPLQFPSDQGEADRIRTRRGRT